jgi:hypothetical protein
VWFPLRESLSTRHPRPPLFSLQYKLIGLGGW